MYPYPDPCGHKLARMIYEERLQEAELARRWAVIRRSRRQQGAGSGALARLLRQLALLVLGKS